MHSTGGKKGPMIKTFLIGLFKKSRLLTPYLGDQFICIQAVYHSMYLKKDT